MISGTGEAILQAFGGFVEPCGRRKGTDRANQSEKKAKLLEMGRKWVRNEGKLHAEKVTSRPKGAHQLELNRGKFNQIQLGLTRFNHVQPDSYNLQISYPGFAPFQLDSTSCMVPNWSKN